MNFKFDRWSETQTIVVLAHCPASQLQCSWDEPQCMKRQASIHNFEVLQNEGIFVENRNSVKSTNESCILQYLKTETQENGDVHTGALQMQFEERRIKRFQDFSYLKEGSPN